MEHKYLSVIIDVVVLGPKGEKRRGVFTLGFSVRDIFSWPKLVTFDHGFDALALGFWVGLEKPVAQAA